MLVTRPAAEAGRWVRELAARGIDARTLPLIDIVPAPLQGELAEVRAQLGRCHAAMFVSGNAVRGFLGGDAALPALHALATRAWSPGPGTTAALRAAGWPAERIDEPAPDAPQFDSEALWARVHAQATPGRSVLLVRGGDAAGRAAGRDWLAAQLRAAGVEVRQVVAYRRVPPPLGAAQAAQAAQAVDEGRVWLLSSAEAVANLRQGLPALDLSRARALATHPRIAQAARAAGFGAVHAAQPTPDAVAEALASIK
ncbi:MAG: uroporphyrinogen-III synthase [Pseudomonadota bacterium]|nr:uroporphyrinogen-III synthase [Pseudomonadota bacterium]